jgi:hypothetical protein
MGTQIVKSYGAFSIRKHFQKMFLRRPNDNSTALWIPVIPLAALVMLTGCASETLFRSNFDQTPIGQPPATMQDIGTAHIHGPAGSVLVIAPPVLPSGKWVRISRPEGPEVAGFQGTFSRFRGDSVYTFSTMMFMSSGSGIATIQFETFTNPVSNLQAFLHLDFTNDNQIRIDDNEDTKFGSFSRDQQFIVQVTLNINASASTAHIVLSGAGASGERDYTVIPPLQSLSRQFGAVRLWQGFPHTGAFDATNVSVTRKTN